LMIYLFWSLVSLDFRSISYKFVVLLSIGL